MSPIMKLLRRLDTKQHKEDLAPSRSDYEINTAGKRRRKRSLSVVYEK